MKINLMLPLYGSSKTIQLLSLYKTIYYPILNPHLNPSPFGSSPRLRGAAFILSSSPSSRGGAGGV